MKKAIVFLLAFMLVCTLFGCSTPQKEPDGKLSVVTTIFPPYDFARQIGGDEISVTKLLPSGTESHAYEPTPQDIIAIQNADLFIYVGGESDSWVDSILDSMGEDKPKKILALMDCVTPVEEELLDGMQADSHTPDEGDGHEIHPEYDEHVWTSPRKAADICTCIRDALCALDPTHSEDYATRCDAYTEQLNALDADFRDLLSGGATLVFGDRFPFRYFADEYGLTCYAAFPGCSSETEPSAATIAYLIDKVEAEQIPTVFYIEFSNHKIADAIAESTGAATALLHSCHNISGDDEKAGVSYLELMRQNYETLKEALF